ncbi:hypothetical protein GEMRC1_005113 [Eukaryota sp. GEM-RC1]
MDPRFKTHHSNSTSEDVVIPSAFLAVFKTDLPHRINLFAAQIYHSNTVLGSVFGHLFLQISRCVILLLILFLFSFLVLSYTFPFSAFNVPIGIDYFLSDFDLQNLLYYFLNHVVCLFFVSVFPIRLFFTISSYLEREHSINDDNNVDCLKSFNAIFSYKWNNTAKSDVNHFRNNLSNQLKESIEDNQSDTFPFRKESDDHPKVEWANLIFLTFMLFMVFILIVSLLIMGVLRENLFSQFPLAILVCLFNFLGRKSLYSTTSGVRAPQRDSIRVWYLLILKLGFFSAPILVLEFNCFPVFFTYLHLLFVSINILF